MRGQVLYPHKTTGKITVLWLMGTRGYTSASPICLQDEALKLSSGYVYMTWYLVKCRANFTFILLYIL